MADTTDGVTDAQPEAAVGLPDTAANEDIAAAEAAEPRAGLTMPGPSGGPAGGDDAFFPWLQRPWVVITFLLVLAAAVGLGQYLRSERARRETLAASVAADTPAHREALGRAHGALDDGKLDDAFNRYTAVLAADGPDPSALAHLGWVLLLEGNEQAASDLLTESRALQPTRESTWMDRVVRGKAAADADVHLRRHWNQLMERRAQSAGSASSATVDGGGP